MKIKAVLLAAGNSTRFGKDNKLLYPLHHKKLITYALDVLKESGLDCAVVSQYETIQQLANAYEFDFIKNDAIEKGMSYSIQLGVSFYQDADAILFLVGDQPYVRVETLKTMIAMADDTHIICCASKTRRGNPALFPKCYFEELLTLEKDVGGKVLMSKYPLYVKQLTVDEKELWDIDYTHDVKEC